MTFAMNWEGTVAVLFSWDIWVWTVLGYIALHRHKLSANREYRAERENSDCQEGKVPLNTNSIPDLHLKEGFQTVQNWTREVTHHKPAPEPEPQSWLLTLQAVDELTPSLQSVQTSILERLHLQEEGVLKGGEGQGKAADAEVEVFTVVRADFTVYDLPLEVLHGVAAFLRPEEVLSLTQTVKSLSDACNGDEVWRELWKLKYGPMWDSAYSKDAKNRWGLEHWDPCKHKPKQGWKLLFAQFECMWLDILAAGCNSEEGPCLVGIEGGLYDIAKFVNKHPGSPDTLLDNAGRDATQLFHDVGHSQEARKLMAGYLVLEPAFKGCCVLKSVCDEVQEVRKKWDAVPSCEICHRTVGRCHAVFMPVEGTWSRWWSCCGSLLSEGE
ncbi:unnamed protein product [Chrysoparadoxa australica]